MKLCEDFIHVAQNDYESIFFGTGNEFDSDESLHLAIADDDNKYMGKESAGMFGVGVFTLKEFLKAINYEGIVGVCCIIRQPKWGVQIKGLAIKVEL